MTALDTTRRRASDAASRFASTVILLRERGKNAASESERWLAGYEAEALLWKVLLEAEGLVEVLNDDTLGEEVERRARVLHAALRARRLAALLGNVQGRSPEEGELFLRKAGELGEWSPILDPQEREA